MYACKTEIRNATGLHARPASEFVGKAGTFQSSIKIRNLTNDKTANAKSIILLLSMALAQGTPVELEANGPDEREAVEALVGLIDSGFGE